jgi:alpha-ribazole phosphatase
VTLVFARHPEPVGAAGLCYGRTDLPVTPAAVERAVTLVRSRLAGPVGPVVSSPLSRCVALAAALAPAFTTDDRLVELDFGTWEGRRWDELDRAEFDAWAGDYYHRAPPGGEAWGALFRRVEGFLADWRGRDAVIVTHAGVIRAALSLVTGMEPAKTLEVAVPFGGVVEL